MTKIPQKILVEFENNFFEYDEEQIIRFSKTNGNIFAVVNDMCKEVYGLYILDENDPTFICHIFYITKVNQNLKGFGLQISPTQERRNQFVSIFSAYIAKNFQDGSKRQVETVFNTFQNMQILTFEQNGYDIIPELPNKKASIAIKYNGKGIVHIPRITNEIITNNKFEKEFSTVQIPKIDEHFVYLMLNRRNGYFKIGKSKNSRTLKIREKTLQSEEPDMIIVGLWIVKENYEKILHMEFKDKRLRGEWFNLDETDLDFLHNKMKKFACI